MKNSELHSRIQKKKWCNQLKRDKIKLLLTSSTMIELNSDASSRTNSVGASLAPLKLLTLLAVLCVPDKFCIYCTKYQKGNMFCI